MDCGECSLCCDIPVIKELNKKAYKLCSHYCKGCSIYEKRPVECSSFECASFECAYYQMEKVNIALRPDKCGVMFEKITDNIFFGTLYPALELSDIIKGQINAFNKQGFTVIILSPKWKKPKIYLSENHDETQITEEIKKYFNKKQQWQYQVTQQI